MTPTTPAPVLQQTQQGQGEEAQVERAGVDPGWMNGFLSRLPSTRRAPTHVDGPVVHSVHIVQHDEQPEDYFHHAYVGSANASNTDLVDPRYHSQDEK
jgi:hypothetical protein